MAAIREDTAALDTYGPAGTVILMHHRMCHCPGQNRSGLRLRQAIPHDFVKTNVDDGPPKEDMWEDWSQELRAAGGAAAVGLGLRHPAGATALAQQRDASAKF